MIRIIPCTLSHSSSSPALASCHYLEQLMEHDDQLEDNMRIALAQALQRPTPDEESGGAHEQEPPTA